LAEVRSVLFFRGRRAYLIAPAVVAVAVVLAAAFLPIWDVVFTTEWENGVVRSTLFDYVRQEAGEQPVWAGWLYQHCRDRNRPKIAGVAATAVVFAMAAAVMITAIRSARLSGSG
jgi:hypothetical protein